MLAAFLPGRVKLRTAFRILYHCAVRAIKCVSRVHPVEPGHVTRQNAERGGSPLISFNHVIDPHFVT